MSDIQRASVAELLEFANKVREAGGGNPIDALMPAVPQDSEQCLIARNLNFNCNVATNGNEEWIMTVEEKETRDKIAAALDLVTEDTEDTEYVYEADEDVPIVRYSVVLPEEIGKIAADFDEAYTQLRDGGEIDEVAGELAYYIEESILEVYEIGTFNERGELLL